MHSRTGLVHKIERFALHDGPGIRTLVVMKGCPLRCRWCSSPYTQHSEPEILHIKTRCQGCERCIAVCPNNGITSTAVGTPVTTDRSRCVGCGDCVAICPNRARELSGLPYTAQELLREVEKDASFYRRSGGGVTVGGGEPTLQAEFVREFLDLCGAHSLHTAMETCGLTSWERLAPLLDSLDLVYMDLKHMDDRRHLEWTGASNRVILENIRNAARRVPMILRIPIVPGFNDSPKNISQSARFARELGSNLLRLELLPYHPFGVHKYGELEREYAVPSICPPADEHMENLRDLARSTGVDVQIGG